MSETLKEQIDRLWLMAEDTGETWDLSENDQAAIRAVLVALSARPEGTAPEKCRPVEEGSIAVDGHASAIQSRDYGPYNGVGLNLSPSFKWHLVTDGDDFQVLVATRPDHLIPPSPRE